MRAGELCAGYGGLALAVEQVFGATAAWVSEYESAPSKILVAHWPGVPNLGDMTKIDWASVEPVDIISGGTPCQDLSGAGKRAGMTEGTRSNLWVQMREAVAIIKPTYVVWENVRGAFSATAYSEMESGEGRLGGTGADGPFLRALGRVLGDLSSLGYDTQWCGIRAADVGAPHGRYRVFVLGVRRAAEDTVRGGSGGGAAVSGDGIGAGSDTQAHGANHRLGESGAAEATATADTISEHRGQRREPGSSEAQGGRASAVYSGRGGTSTATNTCSATIGQHAREPSAEETGSGSSDRPGDPRGERPDQVERETAADTAGITGSVGHRDRRSSWGNYWPAIQRWERVAGRIAPDPTEPGARGGRRLSPAFVEWLMGLPDGWVTGIDITRNDQLKALGNGVVPQQAAAALTHLLDMMEVAA